MKKLLYTLLAVSLIFSACKKEEEEPTNSGNNNGNSNIITWEKTYGGNQSDVGKSVQQTTDGGYITCGWGNNTWNVNSDIYLMKTDSQGNTLWTKNYATGAYELGFSVQQTTDGGYIICSEKISAPDGYIHLIKTDGNGLEEWQQTYSADQIGYSVQQTNDGGYIICGISVPGNGNRIFLTKINASGNQEWTRQYVQSGLGGHSVQQTFDGGYILCGQESDVNGNSDLYLLKTDEYGYEQWSQNFGTYSVGYSVQQTTDGGYIMTGSEGLQDNVYLIKTDGSGIKEWSKIFGGSANEEGRSVQQTTDEGYIITGWTSSFGTSVDVYLIKTDGSGIEQWSQTFGGSDIDKGYSVQQTTDGGYIICGETYSFGNIDGDVYLIKTDSQGKIISK